MKKQNKTRKPEQRSHEALLQAAYNAILRDGSEVGIEAEMDEEVIVFTHGYIFVCEHGNLNVGFHLEVSDDDKSLTVLMLRHLPMVFHSIPVYTDSEGETYEDAQAYIQYAKDLLYEHTSKGDRITLAQEILRKAQSSPQKSTGGLH